ncbi:MAG: hypothetical protein M3Q09_02145 [Gemmatimonadota bacterium]|nr:hypothetical protein [Gemmatimonadota bacterium]
MRTTLVLHIIAGSLALVSGFVALYAAKGARLHRKAGMVFVCLMLTMSFSGMLIAAVRGVAPALNIPVVLLTAYLVITSLTTVRPLPAGSRWLGLGAMLVALAVGTIDLKFGFDALASPDGKTDEIPPVPFFVFGAVALLGSAGDLRVLRSGPLRGARRLARHLWRMSFALFIAALSFFIGQAQVIPKPVRIFPLLAVPVVGVLVTMFYWLWRVRIKQSFRGIAQRTVSREVPPTTRTTSAV